MGEVKWIKITTDIFDDEKILLIESLPDADSIIVIWFKLLCLAGKMNNSGVFVMNDTVAYTDSMLATIFRRKENTVKLALDTFEQFGMIERIDGTITIPNWGKHQSLDQLENRKEYMRNYMQEYRAKQRDLIGKPNCKVNSKPNVNSLEEDIDKDIYNICAPEPDAREHDFEQIYAIYPKKRGKQRAFGLYCQWLKGKVVNGRRIKLTNRQMYIAVRNYVTQQQQDNVQLTDIRGEHVQKLYNDLVKEGYALSTIKIVSAVLNGCMQQALRNGLIERNPVKSAELPRQTEKATRQAMTREQQALFMECAKESYLYNFYAVMLRTGMRNGEMRGLKYTDIDKKKNVIRVQRTLKYIEGEGYFEDTPKTRTSKRDIPLTAATLQLLEEQRKFWGFKVEKIDRYLFCNELGEPLSRARVRAETDRIVERIRAAGHDFPHITPHVFRHTFATRAIEAGMQPQVLKTILGHSSLAMTMDLYSHVLPETRAEEMEKIANMF